MQKPKTIKENPTDVKQKHEETTLENQAMELIDLISQKGDLGHSKNLD